MMIFERYASVEVLVSQVCECVHVFASEQGAELVSE